MRQAPPRASIILPSVKDSLTQEEVSAAMDVTIAKNIFSTTDGDLKVKYSAQITEKMLQNLL
jgi:hypothetical protein